MPPPKPNVRVGDRVQVLRGHMAVNEGMYVIESLVGMRLSYRGWIVLVRGTNHPYREEDLWWICLDPRYSYLPDDFLNKCREALGEEHDREAK